MLTTGDVPLAVPSAHKDPRTMVPVGPATVNAPLVPAPATSHAEPRGRNGEATTVPDHTRRVSAAGLMSDSRT